jgi:hypothetical protein
MIGKLFRDARGNLAVMAAILAVPAMLAVGAAVDLTNLGRVRSDLQGALDAASMEIAVNLNSGHDDAGLRALGETFLRAHVDPDLRNDQGGPILTYYGLVTEEDGTQSISTSAKYTYKLQLPRHFGYGGDSPVTKADLTVRAKVSSRIGDAACVYALSRTAPRAAEFGGSTKVTMDGCVIASNSSAPDSVYVGGSATLEADCIQSSGGISSTSGLTVDCAENRRNAWPVPDPLALLPEPVAPALFANPKQSETEVGPGRYIDLKLNGTKTLKPGLYYIEGSLSILGDVTGTGVTFFMKDGGVSVNGNASLQLSAPQSGDHAGILFMSARDNVSDNKFNGTGATDLDGFLYFPAGDLEYTGNNSTSSTCLRIAAATVKMSGSSMLKSDCSAELGGRQARVSGPLHFAL